MPKPPIRNRPWGCRRRIGPVKVPGVVLSWEKDAVYPLPYRVRFFLTSGYKVQLKHGHRCYAFLVDGILALAPRGQGIARNDRVSSLPVRGW